jgi:hypothetical protein
MAKGKSPGYEKAQNVGALDGLQARNRPTNKRAVRGQSDDTTSADPIPAEDQMRRERESKSESGKRKGKPCSGGGRRNSGRLTFFTDPRGPTGVDLLYFVKIKCLMLKIKTMYTVVV